MSGGGGGGGMEEKPDVSKIDHLSGFPGYRNFQELSAVGRPTEYTYPQEDVGRRHRTEVDFYEMGLYSGPSQRNSMTPLSSTLGARMAFSPTGGLSSPETSDVSPTSCFSPLQSPLSGGGGQMNSAVQTKSAGAASTFSQKQLCAICGDRASGKHYGIHSCEGCKGFFKRTVRKELQYACRDDKHCVIDKRQRNRCQYCRYQKCTSVGMKREAVQEEKQRARERGDMEVESTTAANSEMPVEEILQAELKVDPHTDAYVEAEDNPVTSICQAAEKQLFSLVEWAKLIPHFVDLPVDDQIILLRAGWNELLIAGFSHRSTVVKDSILLSTGLRIHRSSAHKAGVGVIFDRVLMELVSKMREMAMDKTELGCLRAIVLFNPDAKGLVSVDLVESLREKVYATLDEYCRIQYPEEQGRFAKLLLRLPALRSIGLKCIEHLFFMKLLGDTPLETFLLEMLETSNSP